MFVLIMKFLDPLFWLQAEDLAVVIEAAFDVPFQLVTFMVFKL